MRRTKLCAHNTNSFCCAQHAVTTRLLLGSSVSLRPHGVCNMLPGSLTGLPLTRTAGPPIRMPRRAPVFKVSRLPVTAPAAHSAAGTALVACVSPARPGHGRVAGRAESGCRGTATLNCYAAGATLARSRTVSSYRPLAVSGCKLPLTSVTVQLQVAIGGRDSREPSDLARDSIRDSRGDVCSLHTLL